MKIIKDGKAYCIRKIISFDNWGNSYNIEFEDENGIYRYWKSEFDGGKLVKDDLTDLEVNQGYEIQSRVMVNEKECYVIGYNPRNELSPYVTWLGSLRKDGWTYYWGHYCDTLTNALNDLSDRISNKKYRFDEPTQVFFKLEYDNFGSSGIAYKDVLIDLYDGKTHDLGNPFNNIKILKILPWVELDQILEEGYVYDFDESIGDYTMVEIEEEDE